MKYIFCMNSKCKYYYEDNCTKIYESNKIDIGFNGNCESFEPGEHEGYKDDKSEEL